MFGRNPFKPGAGRKPPLLAGRDELVDSVIRSLDQVESYGEFDRPIIIWGLRGVGKTALIGAFVDYAIEREWVVLQLEASAGENLADQLVQAITLELRGFRARRGRIDDALRHAMGVLRSFQIKAGAEGISLGVDVNPADGYADSGNLAYDLRDLLIALGKAAKEDHVGVLLAVDELQEAAIDDLSALNKTLHALGQNRDTVPVAFIGAGLPSLPSVLAKATSYAERMYSYYEIGLLDADDARVALTKPVEDRGVRWADGALDDVVRVAGGYPYFLQQCGSCVWEARSKADVIDDDDCAAGLAIARREIDRGLYRSRWDRATQLQREFMEAMAQDGGSSSVSAVSGRMGRSLSAISMVRKELLDSGQVYSPERGMLAFAIPGMGDYIRRLNGEV